MKILILHNNNIPTSIVDLTNKKNSINTYTQEVIKQSANDEDTFDEFASKQIERLFQNKYEYDLIVLPYTLSNENHTGFSGIRFATHLRLTSATRFTPLLFLGIDSKEEVAKLTELGSILFTTKVFTSQIGTAEELDLYINELANHNLISPLDENQYASFLNRIKITELENYGPHSVANVWAIKRWTEMLFKNKFTTDAYERFKYQLNFKYIDAQAQLVEKRQGFNKKNTYSPAIENIKDKRIVYVDDEVHKGWGKIMSEIFSASDAELISWEPDSSLTNRDDIIGNIKQFIDNNQNADCYIIDLRLAEEDRNETNFKLLSGHIISRYIKDLNKANQVIIFTASNKIWNLKEEINNIGALGYVLKESPMMNLNREGSIELYIDFVRLVKNAVKLSTLRELVKFQEYLKDINKLMEAENSDVDLNGVYNSIELLLLDKHLFDKTNSNKYNPSQEIIKSVILNQVVFVETYLKKKYTTTLEPKLTLSNNKRMAVKEVSLNKSDIKHNVLGHIFLQSEFEDGYSRVKDVLLTNEQLTEAPSGWNYLSESTQNKNNDLSIMLSAAYGFYSFDEQRLKLLAKMKDIRNSCIAHHGGALDIAFKEIRDFYIDIIGAILRQDYKI